MQHECRGKLFPKRITAIKQDFKAIIFIVKDVIVFGEDEAGECLPFTALDHDPSARLQGGINIYFYTNYCISLCNNYYKALLSQK